MPRLKLEDVQKLSPMRAFERRRRFKRNSSVVQALNEKCCESLEWAYRLRRDIPDLPEEAKRKAELKACESPDWAYQLRCDVPDLSEEAKRVAELKACEDPKWAYQLRRYVSDIPEEIRMKAELKACEEPEYAHILRKKVGGLHPVTRKVLDLIRLGMDCRSAIKLVQQEEKDAKTEA